MLRIMPSRLMSRLIWFTVLATPRSASSRNAGHRHPPAGFCSIRLSVEAVFFKSCTKNADMVWNACSSFASHAISGRAALSVNWPRLESATQRNRVKILKRKRRAADPVHPRIKTPRTSLIAHEQRHRKCDRRPCPGIRLRMTFAQRGRPIFLRDVSIMSTGCGWLREGGQDLPHLGVFRRQSALPVVQR